MVPVRRYRYSVQRGIRKEVHQWEGYETVVDQSIGRTPPHTHTSNTQKG